jgi:hypothetical protein
MHLIHTTQVQSFNAKMVHLHGGMQICMWQPEIIVLAWEQKSNATLHSLLKELRMLRLEEASYTICAQWTVDDNQPMHVNSLVASFHLILQESGHFGMWLMYTA